MSLIRQVWLLILGVILLACAGSVLVSVGAARQSLVSQLSVKNNDNAQSLALSLSQQGGDASLLELGISAQFDTGHYQSIILRNLDGKPLVTRVASVHMAPAVPQWFTEWIPIAAQPGVAQVSSGWNQLGTLEVVSQASFAYVGLWEASLRIVMWTLATGVLAAALAHVAVTRLRQQLDAVVTQAKALMERRFVRIPEPKTPELQRVAHAMNLMVDRLSQLFLEQAQQVEQLRVQASCDPLTGVAHRQHFMACFEARLRNDEGLGATQLVLVRVMRLADINRSLGHRRTDELLCDVARIMGESGSAGVAPVCHGRLNGSDFALLYPSAHQGEDLAEELLQRLRMAFAHVPGAAVVMSSVACRLGQTTGALLTQADIGLAEAESRGDFHYVCQGLEPAPIHGGSDAWRMALQATLMEARVQLKSFPVSDANGQLLHLECPLRLQLEAQGPYEPAARWLPFALRTGLSCDVDMAAVSLALTAIAADGRPRGINLSPQSLANPQFLPRLRERIAAAAASAQHLWIEVDESAVQRYPEPLVELCRQLRPFGIHLGLEHAGDRLASLGLLLEAGLDYVKLAGSWSVGVRHDAARRAWLRSSVSMLHSVGLKVYLEGVQDSNDLPDLWACGVDGVTGPAVT